MVPGSNRHPPMVHPSQQKPAYASRNAPVVTIARNGKRWSFNVNGAYQLPWEMEIAGNLFGKQGTPYPYFRNVTLGRQGSVRVLLNDELDSVRFDNLWNLDLRWAKSVRVGQANLQFIADLFNVMNSNTEITRERNAASPNFQVLGSNLSPRIIRFGVRAGF